MKYLTIFVLCINIISYSQNRFPELSGSYLGQTPPGESAKVFAPKIVSNGFHELGLAISPNGKEMFYIMSDKGYSHYVIVNSHILNSHWTQPELAHFTGDYSNYALAFSPDGNRLYFSSKRPIPGTSEPRTDYEIWYVELQNTKWSEAKHLTDLSSEINEVNMSFTSTGKMYLQISSPSGAGDIYTSEYINGKYQKPVSIGSPINTDKNEARPFIAPDESYLLFHSNREGTLGWMDIYISFRNEDGTWCEPINMGEDINTTSSDFGPMVSPDGKYLFFSSYRGLDAVDLKGKTYNELIELYKSPQNGYATLYWVDSSIISKIKNNR